MTIKKLYRMSFLIAISMCVFYFINDNSVERIKYGMIFFGFLIIIYGIIAFNKHGGDLITPTGLYMLISAFLGGIPSIYMNYYYSTNEIVYGHLIAAFIVFLNQVIIYNLFGLEKNSVRLLTKEIARDGIPKQTYKWGLIFSFITILSGFLISLINSRLDFFSDTSVYLGITVLAVVFFRRGEKGIALNKLLLLLLMFILYYIFIFEGFGRINIATLVLIIVISINHKFEKVNLKLLITVCIFPVLITASLMRGGSFTEIGKGLGSVVSPQFRFGQIIELYNAGIIELSYGKTIWAAIVTFIPRELWLNKPWNFNREITYIFNPQYIEYGHSEASVVHAEWFFNFGYTGLFFGLIATGLLLRFLDIAILKGFDNVTIWTKNDLIKYILVLIISVGLLDIYWGGYSTFMAREGIRILVLFVILIIMMIYLPRRSPSVHQLVKCSKLRFKLIGKVPLTIKNRNNFY